LDGSRPIAATGFDTDPTCESVEAVMGSPFAVVPTPKESITTPSRTIAIDTPGTPSSTIRSTSIEVPDSLLSSVSTAVRTTAADGSGVVDGGAAVVDDVVDVCNVVGVAGALG
ncbi:MAG: hypothetical protein AAFP84_21300, partial [Actinomycetota bacterium]